MESQQLLSLRLTPDSHVKLRTAVGEDTHELTLDRDEFEKFYAHLLRIRAKLDLRDATRGYDLHSPHPGPNPDHGFDRR